MTHIEYFKLQAKNLLKDYKTKIPSTDDYLYEYAPTYFDIDAIILTYDVDEDDFSLMKAQHIIALIVGFKKWADLLNASEIELELAKLFFDNQDKVYVDDWEMYITGIERDNNTTFDPESKLEILKQVFLNGKFASSFQDYRLIRRPHE